MSIDDYQAAIDLTERIKANLPITARPGKQYLKLMQKKGENITSNQELTINSALYMGDEGGICCNFQLMGNTKQAHAASITHLVIDPNHPLAAEIQTYQRQRIHKLKLQNSRGFMAEMRQLSEGVERKKRKSDRGFGK
jgi:hypothetical protein